MIDQSSPTKCAGVKTTSLSLIIEPSGTEIIAISGLHPFRRTGAILDDTESEPPLIHSDHAPNDISRWVNDDRNILLLNKLL